MKKFLKGFGIFVLTDLLLVLTIALLLILPIKKSINNNVIKEMVYSLDLEKMAQDSPKLQEELNKNLEPIYNETRKIGIPDEVVVKIMNIKEVKELVSDATNNLIIAFLTGENQKLINNENINNVLNTAIDDINTKGIYEINDDTKQEIIDIGNEIYEEYQDYVIDTDTILKDVNEQNEDKIELVRFVLSNKMIMYLVIGIVLAIFGLILLKWQNLKWLKHCAIVILIATILASLIIVIFNIVNFSLFKLDYPFIYQTLNKIFKTSYINFVITFVSMIILLIVYGIVKKKGAKPATN